jgi:hypothetical protein
MTHSKHFEHRSQGERLSLGEALFQAMCRGKEVELSFLVGAPAPRQAPETD